MNKGPALTRWIPKKERAFPALTLNIYRHNKLVGKYLDIGFENIFASQCRQYFLGVSNSDLIHPAYIVFDCNAVIIKIQEHDLVQIKPLAMPGDLRRLWCSGEESNPVFDITKGQLNSISIVDTDDTRIDLSLTPSGKESNLKNYANQNWQTFRFEFIIITAILLIGFKALIVCANMQPERTG